MLAPNKQNLLTLQSQKKTVISGHKLLKEKQTGLILAFLELSKKGKALEQKLAFELNSILAKYYQDLTFINLQDLIDSLSFIPSSNLHIAKKRISGVFIETLEYQLKPPHRTHLKSHLQESLDRFAEYFPLLLEISQLKLNCTKLASEIQKVNRQIANLEQKQISLDEEIKFITNFLNEKDSLEKAILIRIFQ
jgi:vacuolar-type H+-ATPase subunit D/Vma8